MLLANFKTVEYEGTKYKIGKPKPSNRAGKKYMVEVEKINKDGDNKTYIRHYGASGMSDYTQHKDKKRRENYKARHQAIKTKDGKPAYKNPLSPSYHSMNHLWSKDTSDIISFMQSPQDAMSNYDKLNAQQSKLYVKIKLGQASPAEIKRYNRLVNYLYNHSDTFSTPAHQQESIDSIRNWE